MFPFHLPGIYIIFIAVAINYLLLLKNVFRWEIASCSLILVGDEVGLFSSLNVRKSGSNINLQCISECLPSIFLYSLVFIFMTGSVTYSPVRSYFVHEHTVSGYILTCDFIRHFESKELWEKSSCYIIHCVRSWFSSLTTAQLNQFEGKLAVNVWDRLWFRNKCSLIPQVCPRHERTRLNRYRGRAVFRNCTRTPSPPLPPLARNNKK